jgi:enterobactin synthetase component D
VAALELQTAFRLDLPHGRCVGVAIADGDVPGERLAVLDPQERSLMEELSPAQQAPFAAGRAALRAAISDLGLPLAPLLRDPRGAPRLPPGVLGSISHKRRLAVALAAVAPAGGPVCALGVDLEELRPLRFDISRRVLTPEERAGVQALPEAERTFALLARFSLKEAFYKAANGFVGRLIGFQEVAIAALDPGGVAGFTGPFLQTEPLAAEGWVGQPIAGYLVASVRVVAAPAGTPASASPSP